MSSMHSPLHFLPGWRNRWSDVRDRLLCKGGYHREVMFTRICKYYPGRRAVTCHLSEEQWSAPSTHRQSHKSRQPYSWKSEGRDGPS